MKNENHKTLQAKPLALVTAGLAAACLLLGVSATQAQLINFDTPGGLLSANNGPFVNYNGAGATGSSGDFWNAIVGTYSGGQGNFTGGTNSGDLLSDDSTSSLITLTLGNSQFYSGGGQGANGTPDGLEGPFLYGPGTPITGTLNNVSAGTYNLFLYVANRSNDPGFDKIDSGTVQVTPSGGSPISLNYANIQGSTVFTAGADYLEFANLAVGAGGTVSFSITGTGNGGNEADFNGLQLQAVPEPSTFALAGLGLVSLAGIRSWKRRQATV
jgi:PEP-CTERM motif-containing protein